MRGQFVVAGLLIVGHVAACTKEVGDDEDEAFGGTANQSTGGNAYVQAGGVGNSLSTPRGGNNASGGTFNSTIGRGGAQTTSVGTLARGGAISTSGTGVGSTTARGGGSTIGNGGTVGRGGTTGQGGKATGGAAIDVGGSEATGGTVTNAGRTGFGGKATGGSATTAGRGNTAGSSNTAGRSSNGGTSGVAGASVTAGTAGTAGIIGTGGAVIVTACPAKPSAGDPCSGADGECPSSAVCFCIGGKVVGTSCGI